MGLHEAVKGEEKDVKSELAGGLAPPRIEGGRRPVGRRKIMATIFLLEKVYGLTKARLVRSRIPWSGDVVNALKRLTSLGLVEETLGKAYRLTENGRMAVERYSMSDPRIRYPYVDASFFVEWDVDALAEYIKVSYPEWVA